jgi:hypothetical protein
MGVGGMRREERAESGSEFRRPVMFLPASPQALSKTYSSSHVQRPPDEYLILISDGPGPTCMALLVLEAGRQTRASPPMS